MIFINFLYKCVGLLWTSQKYFPIDTTRIPKPHLESVKFLKETWPMLYKSLWNPSRMPVRSDGILNMRLEDANEFPTMSTDNHFKMPAVVPTPFSAGSCSDPYTQNVLNWDLYSWPIMGKLRIGAVQTQQPLV